VPRGTVDWAKEHTADKNNTLKVFKSLPLPVRTCAAANSA
jgi:hypothetical protein